MKSFRPQTVSTSATGLVFRVWTGLAATLLCAAATPASDGAGGIHTASRMSEYNVVWHSPSRDSLDSMPLSGMRGAGANIWMQDGHLWIYPAHNEAYDERGRLLKLGCIRITPTQTPWEGGRRFVQTLDLEGGGIRIEVADRPGQTWSMDLWFAGQTLVAEFAAEQAEGLEIAFGTWRDVTRTDMKLDMIPTGPVGQDVVTADASGIRWAHRNADHPSLLPERAGAQNMPPAMVPDPTARLVFGGALVCAGPLSDAASGKVAWQDWQGTAWAVRAPARMRHHLAVALRAGKDGKPNTWAEEARGLLDARRRQQALEAERNRWREFWSRSFIRVNPGASSDSPAWQVGRNYQLFRYLLACNQDGALPLLFNGGIFTADNPKGRITANLGELAGYFGEPSSPDLRRWLFCHFMGQNQRWLGWPTIAGGDPDLIEPSLRFYRDRAGVARERARRLGAEGMVYPEPIDVWGLCGHMPLTNGLCGAAHLTHHFVMALEHAWMALVAREVLGRDIRPDLDWIQGTVRFFDSYYRAETLRRTGRELDDDGRLLIYPANGLELIIGATNPIEVVAGLQRTVSGLLQLDDGLLTVEDRAYLTGLRARLPVLPVGIRGGEMSLLEAQSYERRSYFWELSEFYAAWPYRLVGVTKPETLELLRATWRTVPEEQAIKAKQDLSWMATVANVAAMGDAAQARQRAIDKLSDQRAQVRFPAFFGPGHDWLPDHNWGGSGMVGLQEMLVAAEPERTGKIHLLPAWPRDWDVVFKLHVPGPAVVEGELKQGKITSLSVTPKQRRDAVVLPPDLAPPGRSQASAETLLPHARKPPPNILFILADDLGWGDLRCYGNPHIDTPVLDSLAKQGARLTAHYSPSPLCAPARAAYLTGRYNHRTGAVDVPSNRGLDRMDASEKTFGDYFRHAGYATALIGKWHNGLYCRDHLPHRRGFDLFFGFPNGGQDYWKWNLLRNDDPVPHDGRYLTDVLNDEAIAFIRRRQGKPFALLLAHHAPHSPLAAPEALVRKYREQLGKGAREAVAVTYAMIEAMDTGLGRVFQALKDAGQWENTVIVFTSDNGPVLRRDPQLGSQKRFNGGFSGEKQDVLEGGIRVPAIVAWPRHIPTNQVIATPAHGCDWLPTLFALTGAAAPADAKPFDGFDLMPLLLGQPAPALTGRALLFQRNRYAPVPHCNAAIREGRWKLYWPGDEASLKKDNGRDNPSYVRGLVRPHWEMPLDRQLDPPTTAPQPLPRLYDLEADPAEQYDLAATHPEIVRSLARKHDAWFAEVIPQWQQSRMHNLEHDRAYWKGRALPDAAALFKDFWQWKDAPAGTDTNHADPLKVFRGFWNYGEDDK